MAVRVSTILSIAVIVGIIVAGVFFFAPRFQTGTTGEPDFTILVDPSNPSIARQESDNVTVEVRSLNNFNSRVALSLNPPQTPPANVTAQLERTSLIAVPNLPVLTRAMFEVGENAPVGVYNYTVTGDGAGITKSAIISLRVVLRPAILTVTPNQQTVSTETLFKANVTVSDIFNLYGFQFILTFDFRLMENNTVEFGPEWLNRINSGTAFGQVAVEWPSPDVTEAKITGFLTLTDPDAPGFSGNSTLVMIEFRARSQSGTSSLHFDAFNTIMSDKNAQQIETRLIDGSVIVTGGSARRSTLIAGSESQALPFVALTVLPLERDLQAGSRGCLSRSTGNR